MKRRAWALGVLGWLTGAVGGCVSLGAHQAVLEDLARVQQDAMALEIGRDQAFVRAVQCETALNQTLEEGRGALEKLVAAEELIERITGEKTALTGEAETLRRARLSLESELARLASLRTAAAAHHAEYDKLVEKLRGLIDAGTLEVTTRNGRIIVALSSDVVFAPGSVSVRPAAREALRELAGTLAQFDDRRFQVVGHTDAQPIHTARYPSNWELSAHRAVKVVKLLVEDGVPAGVLSAAGSGEHDPLASNDRPEQRAMNRRVEVVFVPNVAELLSFDPSRAPRTAALRTPAKQAETSPQQPESPPAAAPPPPTAEHAPGAGEQIEPSDTDTTPPHSPAAASL